MEIHYKLFCPSQKIKFRFFGCSNTKLKKRHPINVVDEPVAEGEYGEEDEDAADPNHEDDHHHDCVAVTLFH